MTSCASLGHGDGTAEGESGGEPKGTDVGEGAAGVNVKSRLIY